MHGVFQQLPPEGGCASQRVGFAPGRRVLQHHDAALVVGVGEGKRRFRQHVEEALFGFQVVVKSAVVVEVVVGEVGENAAHETQGRRAVLHHGVRAYFHAGVGAAGSHHTGQQLVQPNGIGRGMRSRNNCFVYLVLNR